MYCVQYCCIVSSSVHHCSVCVPTGNPPVIRFWQDESAPVNPLKPHKASAQTVETTVYVLLTAMLRGHASFIKPILSWLTQDQRYGGGFYSTQVANQPIRINLHTQMVNQNQAANTDYQ